MSTRLTVVLDDESLYRRLKLRSAERGEPVKTIVEQALKAYLGPDLSEPRPFDWDAYDRFQERIQALDAEEGVRPTGTRDLSDIKHHLYGQPRPALRMLAEEPTPYDAGDA